MNESLLRSLVDDGWQPGSWDVYHLLILPLVVIIVTCSIIGNFLVILSWAILPSIRNTSNVLLVSLAVVDFLFGLFATPLAFAYSLNNSWLLGESMCFLWLVLSQVFMFVSSYHLVLVAIDRYRVIVEGVAYLQRRTIAQALQPVGFLWFLAFCIPSPLYIDWEGSATYKEQVGSRWTCESNKTPSWVLLTKLWNGFVPFVSLVVIYLKAYGQLRQRLRRRCVDDESKSTQVKEVKSDNNVQESDYFEAPNQKSKEENWEFLDFYKTKHDQMEAKERKAAITLGILIFAFILCWSLSVTTTLLFAMKVKVKRIVYMFGFLLVGMNSGINPIIHAVRNHDFQKCFHTIGSRIVSCFRK